ncbi:sulfatase-like hydrolase/transferase [Lentisphaera marina]|uniref:sulfatase family protein n=1 Tax=Lentisphaera marina TaxID=1111041 RepID=UPI002365D536|nr:sulfatase-like hydrolase/transferase [Lentisphaera marina]MDD7986590.1 sulfatase-like hydrolase/transferase [Lentisphaera marina]
MKQLSFLYILFISFFLYADKPNIIFIVTDDQLYKTLGCYGGNSLTPNIDSLAENGMKFTNANAASTVCSPARYAILTGRHPSHCKDPHFLKRMPENTAMRIENFVSLENDKRNIAGELQKHGYTTGFVGKSHISEHFSAGGTKLWEKHGLKVYGQQDDPKDPKVNEKMQHNHRVVCDMMKKHGFDYVDAYYLANTRELWNDALNVHNVEWTANAAANFINQNKDKPFFLYYSTTAHHGPDPDIMKGKEFPFSLDADIRMTGAGFVPEGFDIMEDRQKTKERVLKAGYPLRTAAYTWLDNSIGVILNKLREHKIEDNTIIVYMSDHGFEKYQKATCFEGGLKIPMIIQWKKGVSQSRVSNQLIQSIDLAPTLFDICGIEPAKELNLDGKSILPILKGSEKEIHDFIYGEIGYARTIKSQKWKYIAVRYTDKVHKQIVKGGQFSSYKGDILDVPYLVKNSHLGYYSSAQNKNYFMKDQLYRIDKDPEEKNNLFESNPEVAEKIKKALSQQLSKFNRPFGELN